MKLINQLQIFFTKLFRQPVYLGVMGYSGQKFSVETAKSLLLNVFSEVRSEFPKSTIIVVSGLTHLGIPGLAYDLAKELGWKTAGVACTEAFQYKCFPCDEVTIVGHNWGEESQTFLQKCLLFTRIGGGKQTKAETAQAIKMGKRVIEHDLDTLPS